MAAASFSRVPTRQRRSARVRMTQPYHLWSAVEVDGSQLSGAVESLLEQVVVDHHQHLPDMFAITFHDPARDVINQLHAPIGSTVTIKMTPPGSSPKTLIMGEVTGFEAEYDASRLRTILRGYDLSHRLHRGRQTQTYKNVTDSDIARQVAQRAGLQVGQIDSTSVTYDHVSQANQSDWDFLKSRAREIGYEMGMDDGKFYFRKPVQSSGAPSKGDYQSHTDPLQLVFGDDLIEFRPRVTSAEQVSTVKVRGWDPVAKQAVIGSASAGTVAAGIKDTTSKLASTFGGQTFTAVNPPPAAAADGRRRRVVDRRDHLGSLCRGRWGGDGKPEPQGGQHSQRGSRGRPFRGTIHAQRRASRVRRKRLPNPFRGQRPAGPIVARPGVARRIERACLGRRPTDQP